MYYIIILVLLYATLTESIWHGMTLSADDIIISLEIEEIRSAELTAPKDKKERDQLEWISIPLRNIKSERSYMKVQSQRKMQIVLEEAAVPTARRYPSPGTSVSGNIWWRSVGSEKSINQCLRNWKRHRTLSSVRRMTKYIGWIYPPCETRWIAIEATGCLTRERSSQWRIKNGKSETVVNRWWWSIAFMKKSWGVFCILSILYRCITVKLTVLHTKIHVMDHNWKIDIE